VGTGVSRQHLDLGVVFVSVLAVQGVGLAKGVAVSAHADLCDLNLRGVEAGHLASFGLRYGEGPGAKLETA
jgi:hypothetical protein